MQIISNRFQHYNAVFGYRQLFRSKCSMRNSRPSVISIPLKREEFYQRYNNIHGKMFARPTWKLMYVFFNILSINAKNYNFT